MSLNSEKSKEEYTYYEISTVEDLYAMESDKCYQLKSDINLQEREWYPLKVKGFNGNGHTIKNCYINESIKFYCSGFFTEIDWLENTVFENITVNTTFTNSNNSEYTYVGYNSAGIIAGEVGEYCDSITLRGSQSIYNIGWSSNLSQAVRIGGIIGNGAILNSKIEDCTIICNVTSNFNVDIGGLCGQLWVASTNIENNCTINTEINCSCKSYVNCGGIVGSINYNGNGGLSSCITKNNTINVSSSSTTTSRIGGTVGYSAADISNCASIGNNIKLNASYGYNIGGVIGKADGKVTNCLSDSNILEGITASTSTNQYAGVGGLCGSNAATISKSISQNNKIIGTSSTKSDSMFAAGLIASVSASIVKCAVYSNTVNGGNKDIFTSKNVDLLFDCYVADIGQVSPNINNVSTISGDNWKDIINTLSLDEELWIFESGYVNLKIAE